MWLNLFHFVFPSIDHIKMLESSIILFNFLKTVLLFLGRNIKKKKKNTLANVTFGRSVAPLTAGAVVDLFNVGFPCGVCGGVGTFCLI